MCIASSSIATYCVCIVYTSKFFTKKKTSNAPKWKKVIFYSVVKSTEEEENRS